MGPKEIRHLATKLVSQAKAVLNAFPRKAERGLVSLSDPGRSMESFSNDYDFRSWIDLVIFHRTIKMAKQGSVEAFHDLPGQVRIMRREYCRN